MKNTTFDTRRKGTLLAKIMTFEKNFSELSEKIKQLEAENRVLKAQLIEAERRAQESEKLKSAFLANMSHEIRTPMNAILGFSDLLTELELDIDKNLLKEYLEIIKSNGNQLLQLIDDIIDIAKIEAQQLEIVFSECHVNNLLHELLISFNDNIIRTPDKSLDLKLTTPAGYQQLLIETDPYRLKQILSNLIGNAIKFTHEGYVEFGYRIIADHEIEFFVKDTGIGISEEDKQLIFEKFGQLPTKDFRSRPGTGVGLAICKNLAELLGGKLYLESKLNIGSTFYFSLPLVKSQSASPFSDDYAVKNNIDWSSKRILIVEDEESNFRYLKYTLEVTKVKLLRAHNGIQAIDMIRSDNSIDLCLMDIHLPVMNGYDATQIIREFAPDLPIIAQTAFAMPGEKEKSIKAGCNAYISKPISRSDLIKLIDNFINK